MVLVTPEGLYFESRFPQVRHGSGGLRPFTVVPLFHPRVYRKFLQNLQGKLNSRIKIPKPRARIYIALPKSQLPKTKMQIPKVKMKIENRAGKAHDILAWTNSKMKYAGVHYS